MKDDLCFIQETKLKTMMEDIVKSMWGDSPVEWSSKDSQGLSGGMLIIWRKGIITPSFRFYAGGYLGVCADFKGRRCYFINVYSFCNSMLKKRMWVSMISLT